MLRVPTPSGQRRLLAPDRLRRLCPNGRASARLATGPPVGGPAEKPHWGVLSLGSAAERRISAVSRRIASCFLSQLVIAISTVSTALSSWGCIVAPPSAS